MNDRQSHEIDPARSLRAEHPSGAKREPPPLPSHPLGEGEEPSTVPGETKGDSSEGKAGAKIGAGLIAFLIFFAYDQTIGSSAQRRSFEKELAQQTRQMLRKRAAVSGQHFSSPLASQQPRTEDPTRQTHFKTASPAAATSAKRALQSKTEDVSARAVATWLRQHLIEPGNELPVWQERWIKAVWKTGHPESTLAADQIVDVALNTAIAELADGNCSPAFHGPFFILTDQFDRLDDAALQSLQGLNELNGSADDSGAAILTYLETRSNGRPFAEAFERATIARPAQERSWWAQKARQMAGSPLAR